MSKFQHSRDNVLTPQERAESARKCLQLLDGYEERMPPMASEFVQTQRRFSRNVSYTVSEPQLQWLRDLVSKHVTS